MAKPAEHGKLSMTKLTPQWLGGLLLAWNIAFGVLWIGVSETYPINRASAKYGHIEDYDERIALMHQEWDAREKEVRPFYPFVIALVGVNCVLAILVLCRLGQQASTPANY
jgi:hypothetical protein